jgi:hypothetical protein
MNSTRTQEKPQQQTLSIGISDALREFLERSNLETRSEMVPKQVQALCRCPHPTASCGVHGSDCQFNHGTGSTAP